MKNENRNSAASEPAINAWLDRTAAAITRRALVEAAGEPGPKGGRVFRRIADRIVRPFRADFGALVKVDRK